ncbi:uncharacterized protein LOC123382215 isoform X6 [Felis catus]|uniref:Uncharacterized protein n=2 Tax=Felis catus TaxID=9685 RepID=A0ABI7X4W8_FELCA|nr:uncharacterized protein LOC123382215 isoform X6 [Felis catus]
METGWRLIHSTREGRTHMKEKDKEGADREEEKEGRQKINYRWTQKTQVTAIRRQRDQPSEKEDRQGNKNDGTLYTPDDLSVCPAETLGCFRLELSVIQFEEGRSMGIAVFRLQRLLDALGSRLWVTGQGPCPPCEGHPQRPVPLFLAKLLELLQGACARHLPSA